MRIYTKTGDKGTTSLIYGQRVSKNDIRVEAYGSCDEANSMIGMALSHLRSEYFSGKEKWSRCFIKCRQTCFMQEQSWQRLLEKKLNGR